VPGWLTVLIVLGIVLLVIGAANGKQSNSYKDW
jgi:hypothetical protein